MGSSITFFPCSPVPCKLRSLTPMVLSQCKHSQSCRLRERSFICSLEGKLETSWAQLVGNSVDDVYGGWSVLRVEKPNINEFSRFVSAGTGISVVTILLAAVTYCSYSRKCFTLKFCPSFGIFHLLTSGISKGTVKVTESASSAVVGVSVESTEDKSGGLNQENKAHDSGGKKQIIAPLLADSTQLEALYALKKLKIIDYDASADNLCTKRDFARWLVKANFILERKAKNRIIPGSMIPGSFVPAFDDVNTDDPEFWCIQALGEAGIVSSRLSSSNISSLSEFAKLKDGERFFFFPDNFISRLDLLNWRALFEYPNFSELEEKISQTKLHLLDLSTFKQEASPQLLMDLLSWNGSIVGRTFGNIRRLQPKKPITNAQAAVALASGRMAEAICTELSRIEAEELSRLAEMEEIRVELLSEGVTKYWEEKLSKEKECELLVDRHLKSVLLELEMVKASKEESRAQYMKEKADLESQQQMLYIFKKDVDEMCAKLDCERTGFTTEKQKVESRLKELCKERDAVFKAKSALEAEKEAIQILRSWVEEDTGKIQERAKVLQLAAQRWRVAGGTAMAEQ